MKKFDEAIEVDVEATKIDPLYAVAFTNLCAVYIEMHRRHEAELARISQWVLKKGCFSWYKCCVTKHLDQLGGAAL
jgi:hypothetical protein